MPLNEGTSDRKQNKTETSKEPNTWLLERPADRALPLTARSPIHVRMPPVISYVRQQSRHLGESSSQLARQVMYRSSWASTMSRAMHVPVLSKVFDFIQRTAAFVTPMYQRMLDLPWFRRRRKPRRGFTQTRGAMAERQLNTISLQANELYPNMLLQTLSDTGEEQVGDEADETYPRATEETYPMLSNDLLSRPLTRRAPVITTNDFPRAASATNLPLHTKKITDRHYPNEPTRLWNVTTKEQPVPTADETYPLVIKNMFLPPAGVIRLPDTASEAPHFTRATSMPLISKQIIDGLETEGGSEFISSDIGQGGTTIPGVYLSYQIRQPDHRQTKAAEDRLGEVSRQPHHTYRNQTLYPVSMPITQRMNLQPRLMEARSYISGEGMGEIQSSNMLNTGASDGPIVQAIHTFRPLATSRQSATLQHKSSLHASPAWSGSPIFRHASKTPGPSMIPRTARYLSELASNTLLPDALTYSESAEVLPGGISRRSVPQIEQAQRQKPLVASRVEVPGQKAYAIHQTERMIGDNQSKDALNLGAPEHGSIVQGFASGYVNRPLFYREPLSVAGSAIQPSPAYESIHHAMTLATQRFSKSIYHTDPSNKTENYRFVPNREYIPSYPSYKYARQQAPELPLASLIQPEIQLKAESDTAYRREALTGTPDIFPELTYSRKQNVPELALAPISRQSETLPRPIVPELQKEESSEGVAKDELDDIARDVYNILKRRLVRERERALGVI